MAKKYLQLVAAILIFTTIIIFIFHTSQGVGYIKIDSNDVELRLRGGWFGLKNVNVTSGAATVVKTGSYRPVRVHITKKQGADQWSIFGVGPWGQLQKIRVRTNQTVTLKLGPPFIMKPQISTQRNLRNINIGLVLKGQAQEGYAASSAMKNGIRLPEPVINIMDMNDMMIATDKMAYG